MRIPCPFCGDRDVLEFVYRGDASVARAASEASAATLIDSIYLRDNVAGPMREHWYHAQGCRNWLVVTRDTRTHAISDAALAKGSAA
jgi:heterotetrameric sarcosine oxidase delta subunit